MHTFFYLFLFLVAGLKSFSQQPYFLYIQSDERQPFYIRLDEKIYSSSESGYLIIPNLEDGNYNLLLGFPRNLYPEHRFQVNTAKKDKGFLLKHFSDKGWQLVNLQNQAVINNSSTSIINTELTGEKKSDAFSVMLANVVNDSAILYPQPKPEVVQAVTGRKPATVTKVDIKDSVTDSQAEALVKKEAVEKTVSTTPLPGNGDTTQTLVKIKEVTNATVYQKKDEPVQQTEDKKVSVDKPFISKISEEKTGTAYKAIYLEQYNYTTDTVDVLILTDVAAATKPEEKVTRKTENEEKVAKIEPEKKSEIMNDDSSRSIVLQMGSITDTFKVKKKIIMTNSDCKNFATANDVDKLRIRLMGEKNIDDQLAAARKYYRTKCFTVQQIRALTELFPTDEMKYRFIDLSYAYASDSGNYYLLEEVITDNYYKNRFKAMIRK